LAKIFKFGKIGNFRQSCDFYNRIKSYNEINGLGGKLVAKSIIDLDRLESVNLNGNQFGDSGCDEIWQVMEENQIEHKLEPLDEDNDPDDENLDDYDEYDDEDENKENISIDDFWTQPSLDGFVALGAGKNIL